ncbi:hypothetical protein TNCV_3919091 [Trichonephila clavipes]|nr:hypothetical protein TNCV_3919091 [Trichonephila clavipes]
MATGMGKGSHNEIVTTPSYTPCHPQKKAAASRRALASIDKVSIAEDSPANREAKLARLEPQKNQNNRCAIFRAVFLPLPHYFSLSPFIKCKLLEKGSFRQEKEPVSLNQEH